MTDDTFEARAREEAMKILGYGTADIQPLATESWSNRLLLARMIDMAKWAAAEKDANRKIMRCGECGNVGMWPAGLEYVDEINSLKAKLAEKDAELREIKAIADKLRALSESQQFIIDELKTKLAEAEKALEKIAIENDENNNFSRSEDECQFYIENAKEALKKIRG